MAWTNARAITVSGSLCGTANSTNFPMLVSGTYSYLATVANGGKVTNANGYDIGFFSDAALTMPLYWETELYTATTGQVIYWVNIPTLTYATNTVIYMAYGNSSITTDQSNRTATWNSNFAAVYHMPNGTTLNVNDSTINAANGTNHGATATAGQIDGAAAFASSHYISIPTYTPGNNFAMSGWINSTGTGVETIFVYGNNTTGEYCGFGTGITSSKAFFYVQGASATVNISNSKTVNDGTWHYIVAVRLASNSFALYVDNNTPVTSSTVPGSFTLNASSLGINLDGGGIQAYTGSLDEVRYQTATPSTSQMTAEYNNQSSPSTFYSVGTQYLSQFNALLLAGD